MVTYILRRLVAAVLILFAASFLMYVLLTFSGDPLQEFRESAKPNAHALMAAREKALHLDVPLIPRYFMWLGGALGCLNPLGTTCDLGTTFKGQLVTEAIASGVSQTLQLVTASTILAIIIGIALGVVAALRQYSGLDYGITFMAFVCYSLPSFWIAVLLKQYGAIGFNNWLVHPTFSLVTCLVTGLIAGLVWYLASYGKKKTRYLLGAAGFVLTTAIMLFLSATRWFLLPGLGIPFILVLGLVTALCMTILLAGLRDRSAVFSGLAAVLVGLVIYFPIQGLLDQATALMMVILLVITLLLGAGIGWTVGKLRKTYDRGQSVKVAMWTSFFMGLYIAIDRYMQAWPTYIHSGRIGMRPLATANSATPNLTGDFWIMGLDRFTHLLLPTVGLTLLALASYSRYTRASMLEIMSQDYIRTARAKGVSERVVVVKHAFRNALIPLATLVAFDIGGIIGGAIITERVFGFSGMGALFATSLDTSDIYPLMGVFLVTGLTAMVFNLVADLLYSVLDPRVRVKA